MSTNGLLVDAWTPSRLLLDDLFARSDHSLISFLSSIAQQALNKLCLPLLFHRPLLFGWILTR